MDEVTKSCRKLGNEELHNFDFPPSVIRLIRTKGRDEEECSKCGGDRRNT